MTRVFHLFGVPIRMHAALPVMMCLAFATGCGAAATLGAVSLILHELSHIAMARNKGVRVIELELLPFGGAARMDNPWRMRMDQLLPVALAGPACNLLLCAVACGFFPRELAKQAFLVNAALFLFNLLPALPLDGGRIAVALLAKRMGMSKAIGVCANAGRVISCAMLIGTLAAYLQWGVLNLSYPICAAFLLAAASREIEQAGGVGLVSLLGRSEELDRQGVLPVRWLAAREGASAETLLRTLKPGYIHRFLLFDKQMRRTAY